MPGLHQDIETLIFCAIEPVSVADLVAALRRLHGPAVTEETVLQGITLASERYAQGPYPFAIAAVAGGYRFMTKPEGQPAVKLLLAEQARKRLSASAMETLAIVAYKQPCTKGDVEQVRGVSCDYTIPKLLERGLIAIAGRRETPGRPVIYQTTNRFLEHLGIASLRDLPPLREAKDTFEIGEADSILSADTDAAAALAASAALTPDPSGPAAIAPPPLS